MDTGEVKKTNPFNVRLGRRHYLLGMLFFAFISYILIAFPVALIAGDIEIGKPVASYISIPIILYLAVRRFHDIGKSAKPYVIYKIISSVAVLFISLFLFTSLIFLFTPLITILDLVIGLYLLLTPGSEGENQYGSPTNHMSFNDVIFGVFKGKEDVMVTQMKKKIRKISLLVSLLSFLIFVLLMIFWNTASDAIAFTLIGLFFGGILSAILAKLLAKLFVKRHDSQGVSVITKDKKEIRPIYWILPLVVIGGLLIGILVYKNINRTPTIYECLELGSDSARRKCLNVYHPGE